MLHTKALYNSFRYNQLDDPDLDYDSWCTEDLRALSIDELFSRLKSQKIELNKSAFFNYSENTDSPEELADLLIDNEGDPKGRDQVYLLLFEIWRRLLPEKQTISIFCDELDHRIYQYDNEKIESDEPIQDALANLEEILDENIDAGANPKDVFDGISEYLAHDLETFLYDYISELLDQENTLYASELLDGFSSYMEEKDWFEFLRARLLSFSDIHEANETISRLLNRELELPLLLEILRFLASAGDRSLFVKTAKKISPLLETKGEFQEVLSIVSEYYRRLDLDSLEQAIQNLMKEAVPSERLDHNDPDFKAFSQILKE